MPERTVTKMKTKTSEKIIPKNKYATIAKALNKKVKIQAIGCAAMFKSYFPGYCA
jgi:hypothetical protein